MMIKVNGRKQQRVASSRIATRLLLEIENGENAKISFPSLSFSFILSAGT